MRSLPGLALAVSILFASSGRADEGMWTVDAFPRELVKQRLGVAIDDAWLQHARLSAVRFNSGGSGSFVSRTGLVLTNHHVGADCIAKLGSAAGDFYRDGFYAKSSAEELRCPDLEIDVLQGIEDVTAQVQRAYDMVPDDDRAESMHVAARRAKMAELEKACAERTHQRCDVVTLFRGGRYALYRYKRYEDVRLVFAPELAIAFFGGDQDNFTYPRYDLDVALFRVYEKGKPIEPQAYLRWAPEGVFDGDPTFTVGHPGTTERLSTVAMLTNDRDLVYPGVVAELERQHALEQAYAKRGADEERAARKLNFSIENSLKAYSGYLRGLGDASFFKRREAAEQSLEARSAAKDAGVVHQAHADIAAAEQVRAQIWKRWFRLESDPRRAFTERNPFGSRLFGLARGLVRLVDEKAKPSPLRLREYGDAALPALELELYSPAPIDLGLEEVLFTSALETLRDTLGAKDPVVKAALAGQTPAARAHALVRRTKLLDVAFRKSLATSRAAQDAAHDPMIDFARAIEPAARALRARMDDEVEGREETALGAIARAQHAVFGDDIAPDATFTLRVSFGRVAGYREDGHNVPPITVLAGLYARSQKTQNAPPYELPKRWLERKHLLRPTQPMNFVTTNDIIGGSSGSPVLNARGELVGLVFDENQGALPNVFGYHEGTARAVCVYAGEIVDALRKVYDAGALVDEIAGKP